MTTKKTNKANLDKKRGLFFQIGLIISILAIVIVFEIGREKTELSVEQEIIGVNLEMEMMPITQKEQLKPSEPKKIQSLEIVIKDDKQIIDNGKELDYNLLEELPDFSNYEVNIEEEPEIDFTCGIISFADHMPEFYGGRAALLKYIYDNVKYPIEAQENGIQGTVYLRFVVEKDGSIGEIEIIRGVHELIDTEAINVVKNMPDWKPGKHRGRKVSVWFTIPIVFQLI